MQPKAGFLVALFILMLGGELRAGIKVYYARHGETKGNVNKDKNLVLSRDEVQQFTERGEQQVEALTQALKKDRFDLIAVSPTVRTRNTILPYLKEEKLTAEIWPELAEITVNARLSPGQWPPASPDLFTGGGNIRIPKEQAGYFSLRTGGIRQIKISSTEDPVQREADKRAVTEKLVQLIFERVGGTDKSILLVGHGGNGRRLLENLLSRKRSPEAAAKEMNRVRSVHNAGISMVEEQPDGSFNFMMLNNEPIQRETGAGKAEPAK